jgi:hypothetical protein
MELRPWHGCRERHLLKITIEQATDIILNCRTANDDGGYAEKYGLHREYVRKIRTGRHWWWLREELRLRAKGAS